MRSNVCICNEKKINITDLFSLDRTSIGDLVCVTLHKFHYNENIEYHNALILDVNIKKRSFDILLSDAIQIQTINTQQTYTKVLFR